MTKLRQKRFHVIFAGADSLAKGQDLAVQRVIASPLEPPDQTNDADADPSPPCQVEDAADAGKLPDRDQFQQQPHRAHGSARSSPSGCKGDSAETPWGTAVDAAGPGGAAQVTLPLQQTEANASGHRALTSRDGASNSSPVVPPSIAKAMRSRRCSERQHGIPAEQLPSPQPCRLSGKGKQGIGKRKSEHVDEMATCPADVPDANEPSCKVNGVPRPNVQDASQGQAKQDVPPKRKRGRPPSASMAATGKKLKSRTSHPLQTAEMAGPAGSSPQEELEQDPVIPDQQGMPKQQVQEHPETRSGGQDQCQQPQAESMDSPESSTIPTNAIVQTSTQDQASGLPSPPKTRSGTVRKSATSRFADEQPADPADSHKQEKQAQVMEAPASPFRTRSGTARGSAPCHVPRPADDRQADPVDSNNEQKQAQVIEAPASPLRTRSGNVRGSDASHTPQPADEQPADPAHSNKQEKQAQVIEAPASPLRTRSGTVRRSQVLQTLLPADQQPTDPVDSNSEQKQAEVIDASASPFRTRSGTVRRSEVSQTPLPGDQQPTDPVDSNNEQKQAQITEAPASPFRTRAGTVRISEVPQTLLPDDQQATELVDSNNEQKQAKIIAAPASPFRTRSGTVRRSELPLTPLPADQPPMDPVNDTHQQKQAKVIAAPASPFRTRSGTVRGSELPRTPFPADQTPMDRVNDTHQQKQADIIEAPASPFRTRAGTVRGSELPLTPLSGDQQPSHPVDSNNEQKQAKTTKPPASPFRTRAGTVRDSKLPEAPLPTDQQISAPTQPTDGKQHQEEAETVLVPTSPFRTRAGTIRGSDLAQISLPDEQRSSSAAAFCAESGQQEIQAQMGNQQASQARSGSDIGIHLEMPQPVEPSQTHRLDDELPARCPDGPQKEDPTSVATAAEPDVSSRCGPETLRTELAAPSSQHEKRPDPLMSDPELAEQQHLASDMAAVISSQHAGSSVQPPEASGSPPGTHPMDDSPPVQIAAQQPEIAQQAHASEDANAFQQEETCLEGDAASVPPFKTRSGKVRIKDSAACGQQPVAAADMPAVKKTRRKRHDQLRPSNAASQSPCKTHQGGVKKRSAHRKKPSKRSALGVSEDEQHLADSHASDSAPQQQPPQNKHEPRDHLASSVQTEPGIQAQTGPTQHDCRSFLSRHARHDAESPPAEDALEVASRAIEPPATEHAEHMKDAPTIGLLRSGSRRLAALEASPAKRLCSSHVSDEDPNRAQAIRSTSTGAINADLAESRDNAVHGPPKSSKQQRLDKIKHDQPAESETPTGRRASRKRAASKPQRLEDDQHAASDTSAGNVAPKRRKTSKSHRRSRRAGAVEKPDMEGSARSADRAEHASISRLSAASSLPTVSMDFDPVPQADAADHTCHAADDEVTSPPPHLGTSSRKLPKQSTYFDSPPHEHEDGREEGTQVNNAEESPGISPEYSHQDGHDSAAKAEGLSKQQRLDQEILKQPMTDVGLNRAAEAAEPGGAHPDPQVEGHGLQLASAQPTLSAAADLPITLIKEKLHAVQRATHNTQLPRVLAGTEPGDEPQHHESRPLPDVAEVRNDVGKADLPGFALTAAGPQATAESASMHPAEPSSIKPNSPTAVVSRQMHSSAQSTAEASPAEACNPAPRKRATPHPRQLENDTSALATQCKREAWGIQPSDLDERPPQRRRLLDTLDHEAHKESLDELAGCAEEQMEGAGMSTQLPLPQALLPKSRDLPGAEASSSLALANVARSCKLGETDLEDQAPHAGPQSVSHAEGEPASEPEAERHKVSQMDVHAEAADADMRPADAAQSPTVALRDEELSSMSPDVQLRKLLEHVGHERALKIVESLQRPVSDSLGQQQKDQQQAQSHLLLATDPSAVTAAAADSKGLPTGASSQLLAAVPTAMPAGKSVQQTAVSPKMKPGARDATASQNPLARSSPAADPSPSGVQMAVRPQLEGYPCMPHAQADSRVGPAAATAYEHNTAGDRCTAQVGSLAGKMPAAAAQQRISPSAQLVSDPQRRQLPDDSQQGWLTPLGVPNRDGASSFHNICRGSANGSKGTPVSDSSQVRQTCSTSILLPPAALSFLQGAGYDLNGNDGTLDTCGRIYASHQCGLDSAWYNSQQISCPDKISE